jgi:hypothetical protein
MIGNSSDDPLQVTLPRMFLDQDQWKECVRRVLRVDVEPSLHRIWIGFPELSDDFFNVRTISELGACCALDPLARISIERDHVLDVTLILDNETYCFEGRIRYENSQGFAIEFIKPPEHLRSKIRLFFKPELLAKGLAPFISYTSMEPGSNATLIYSDGDSNRMQIALVNEQILAIFVDLEVLDAHVQWKRKSAIEGDPIQMDTKKRVINFVKNLPGLKPGFLQEIESILKDGKLSLNP